MKKGLVGLGLTAAIALGLTAPAFGTEAHLAAVPAIECGHAVGTIAVQVWATDHGTSATVTDAWGLNGDVKGFYNGKTYVADAAVAPAHVFVAQPGTYKIGVTLHFTNGFISSDERTVTVPAAFPCPTTTTTKAPVVTTTTKPAVTTTLVGDVTTVKPTVTTLSNSVPPGHIVTTTTEETGTNVTQSTLARTGAHGYLQSHSLYILGLVLLGAVLVILGRRSPRTV